MNALVKPERVHDLIDAHWHATQPSNHRVHLGGSVIGRKCSRQLWYIFRWVTDMQHSGRLLRLFNRGHEEEARFERDLKAIGIEILTANPRTGRQFLGSMYGGHYGGSGDGLLRTCPGAPEGRGVCEMKTHSDKSFKNLCKKKVQKAKPEHYAQMQQYMKWFEAQWSLYIAVNKNDDTLYTEIVLREEGFADMLEQRALEIICSDRPPARISNNPDSVDCNFCDHKKTCHADKPAAANCRTCLSATPITEGEHAGQWWCSHWNTALSEQHQRDGGQCPAHLYIPDLIPYAEAIDAGDNPRFVKYRMKGDDATFEFINSGEAHASAAHPPAPAYPSAQLQHLAPELVSDLKLESMVRKFDGEIVEGGPTTPAEFFAWHPESCSAFASSVEAEVMDWCSGDGLAEPCGKAQWEKACEDGWHCTDMRGVPF